MSSLVTDVVFHSGLHGYCHEFVSTLNDKQQRDVMEKSIEVLSSFLGKRPRGWTAPAWDTSKETIQILEEYGIVSWLNYWPGVFDSHLHLAGIRSFIYAS